MTSQLLTLRQTPVPLDLDLKGHMMNYSEGIIIFYRATTFFDLLVTGDRKGIQ